MFFRKFIINLRKNITKSNFSNVTNITNEYGSTRDYMGFLSICVGSICWAYYEVNYGDLFLSNRTKQQQKLINTYQTCSKSNNETNNLGCTCHDEFGSYSCSCSDPDSGNSSDRCCDEFGCYSCSS